MADIDTTSTDELADCGSSFKGKLLLGGAIGIIIVFECMLAYFLLPSAEDIAEAAQEKLAAEQQVTSTAGEADDDALLSEVELGDFYVTDHKVEANATWHIQFMLWAVVATDDLAKFEELLQHNQNRLRDRIIAVIRNSNSTDLSDAGLGLIRRRILETSNTLFGDRLVREVSFSNYRFRID